MQTVNVELAKAAHAAGVKTFVFISSAGTRGMLSGYVPYSKMKMGVEDTIKGLGFEHAIILRPGLILGDREVPKTAFINSIVYGLGNRVSKGIQDSIGQEGEVIGRAAVKAALLAREGKAPGDGKWWVLEGADILKYGNLEPTETKVETAA